MYIFLIRHGQSEGNVIGDATGIIHGRRDTSKLTDLGKKQIISISQSILKQHPETKFHIWHSPTVRTTESAKILSSIIHPYAMKKDEVLYDIHFGAFEGISWQEGMKKYPGWFEKFKDSRFGVAFPEGESREDLHNRLKVFIRKKLFPTRHRYHIIVTHEEVVRAFLSIYHPDPIHYHRRDYFRILNGSLSAIFLKRRSGLASTKGGIVFEVGHDEAPAPFASKKFLAGFSWYLKYQSYPDEFVPQKNFSDNGVFTAVYQDRKETVKVIPPSFVADVKKDISLSSLVNKQGLSTPEVDSFEKGKNWWFMRRSYLEGEIAEYWLGKKEYMINASRTMGQVLKNIHQTPVGKTKLMLHSEETWKKKFVENWIANDLAVLKTIKHPFLDKVLTLYDAFLQDLKVESIGLLHNDFSSFNIAFKEKKDELVLTGVWDFERSFTGDFLWDLGVTQKISFLRRQELFKQLLQSYLGRKPTIAERKCINIYTLMNTTGAIAYRYKRKRGLKEELKNLKYVLRTLL